MINFILCEFHLNFKKRKIKEVKKGMTTMSHTVDTIENIYIEIEIIYKKEPNGNSGIEKV